MATLILKEFRCLAATEDSGDSPYFLVFEGDKTRPAAEAQLVRVRREAWDDQGIDDGQYQAVHHAIATSVEPGHVVVAALMEEDDGPDITSGDFTYVRDRLRATFEQARDNGTASTGSIRNALKATFWSALIEAGTNDDIINVGGVSVNVTSGGLPLVYFYGDGGAYRVRFTMG